MKKYISLCISLLCINIVFGQTSNLEKYYNNIHKAEMAIVTANYDSVTQYYTEAFKYKECPFSLDMYNATLAAIVTKSYPQALNYLTKLFELGFTIKRLDTIKISKEFLASPFGKEARLLEKNTKPIYNIKYKMALDTMVYEDQYFRLKPGSYKVYRNTIRKIDKKNVEKFLTLVNQYGFPSEEKIGILGTNSVFDPEFYVLQMHVRHGSLTYAYNFSTLLKSATLAGELRNNLSARLIQDADGETYYDTYGIVKAEFDTTLISRSNNGDTAKKDTTYTTEWGYFKLEPKEIEDFNKNRKSIYLDVIDENVKKIIFCIKNNPVFLFDANTKKLIFKQGNYTDFLHIKNNLVYP